MRVHNH